MPTTPTNDIVIESGKLKEILDKLPPPKVFSTGMEGLDYLTGGGFGEGEMTVIVGSAKNGKTSFCITLTKNFAKQGIPCLWFSIELTYKNFIGLFGDDLPQFYVPMNREKTSAEWVIAKIEEGVKKYGVKVVFIDHLGLITDEDTYHNYHAIEIVDARIAKIARAALKYNVSIICVAEHDKATAKASERSEMKTTGIRGTIRLPYTASTILGIERLMGVNKARTWQEMEPDEAFIRSDMWLYVLESRRTGARKIRIRCQMNDQGDIIEEPREASVVVPKMKAE